MDVQLRRRLRDQATLFQTDVDQWGGAWQARANSRCQRSSALRVDYPSLVKTRRSAGMSSIDAGMSGSFAHPGVVHRSPVMNHRPITPSWYLEAAQHSTNSTFPLKQMINTTGPITPSWHLVAAQRQAHSLPHPLQFCLQVLYTRMRLHLWDLYRKNKNIF